MEKIAHGDDPNNLWRKLAQPLYDLPFVSDLWRQVGVSLNCSSGEVLERVQECFSAGLIREIGPVYDIQRMGYRSTLVAGCVPSDRIESVAEIVSAHPGVSHNYQRDGSYNLWFTLAVAGDEQDLARELETLSTQAQVPFRRFDMIETYKISFRLTGMEPEARRTCDDPKSFHQLDRPTQHRLAAVIAILQKGLPLVLDPFRQLALASGLGEDGLLAGGRELKSRGILRRFGVVWRHRQLGFTENVLCVWQVPDDQLSSFADHVRNISHITHCYRRRTWPDWPWQVYTMIHGKSLSDCRAIIEQLQQAFPQARYLPMRTVKEFKKSRVNYKPVIL